MHNNSMLTLGGSCRVKGETFGQGTNITNCYPLVSSPTFKEFTFEHFVQNRLG